MSWVVLVGTARLWFGEDGHGPHEALQPDEVVGPFETEGAAIGWISTCRRKTLERCMVFEIQPSDGYVFPWNRPDSSDAGRP